VSLSAANVVQAKTGSVTADPASVSLDAPTTEGSTVIVEISLGGLPIMDGGMTGDVPAGFCYDACSINGASRYQHVFRLPNVAAGEGEAGVTPWDFSIAVATPWIWRVTEWDRELDPVFPLETATSSGQTGSGPTTQSTGTTTENGRSRDLVALAWHIASVPSATSGSWGSHTNSFTERDDQFLSSGATRLASSWSWAFAAGPTTFETTATLTASARGVSDVLTGLVVVYAATTYEV
jgi:hypothetical protein